MLIIRSFRWEFWPDLWQVRRWQLAEDGIQIDKLPERPDLSSPYEPDFHRIAEVYLTGAGNFWLAWQDETPVGYVGAQDIGGAIELRRMYVYAPYRRQGIGATLAQTLIEHCRRQPIQSIELWTETNGLGRPLYTKLGFTVADQPGALFKQNQIFGQNRPVLNAIRMCLKLM